MDWSNAWTCADEGASPPITLAVIARAMEELGPPLPRPSLQVNNHHDLMRLKHLMTTEWGSAGHFSGVPIYINDDCPPGVLRLLEDGVVVEEVDILGKDSQ